MTKESTRMATEAKKMAHTAQLTANRAEKSAAVIKAWISEHEKVCADRWLEVKSNSADIKQFLKFISVTLIAILTKIVFFA
jgi:methyl-accepting chemotaxis protein|tara:strand:+ start:256 stop:498 length:243 start_codon:yes stop_codon:yes gene_type:complete